MIGGDNLIFPGFASNQQHPAIGKHIQNARMHIPLDMLSF